MFKANTSFMARLKAAAITTILLVTYHQVSQDRTNNILDNSTNNLITVRSVNLSLDFLVARQ